MKKKNAPGCPCCGPGTGCGVTINGSFAPLSSSGFCPPPQTLRYAITGTTTGGIAVSISGNISTAQYSGSSYAWTLTFSGAQLPDGTYSGHFFEVGTNPCQSAFGPTGRFDVTQGFNVACPKSTATVVLPAAFDFVTGGGQFKVVVCDPQPFVAGDTNPAGWGRTTCLGDTLTPTVTVSVSGPASICSRVEDGQGSVIVQAKVTGYPVTIAASCTAPNCYGDSVTTTWTGCNAGSATTGGEKFVGVVYKYIPIWCYTVNDGPGRPNKPVPGATVTVSGPFNGTDVTNDKDIGATVCALKHMLVTIDRTIDPAADYTWTVSAPGYRTATYHQATTFNNETDYAGLYCPLGGYLEKINNPGPGNPGGGAG